MATQIFEGTKVTKTQEAVGLLVAATVLLGVLYWSLKKMAEEQKKNK